MPANQSTIAKLMATAAPTPGTRDAARIAARSSGTARRTCLPRRSGGSDSGSVRSASRKLTAASPAATKAGSALPVRRPGIAPAQPPMNGPKMKPRPKAMPMIPMPRARCSGGGHVGDVGLRDGDVRGGDAAEGARRQQQQQRRRRAEQRHPDGGGGDAPQQHRPPPHPIRQPPPDRDEEELHDRVDGARHGRDEVAGAEAARQRREKGDHQAEPEQVDEHRQEQRADRGGARPARRGRGYGASVAGARSSAVGRSGTDQGA